MINKLEDIGFYTIDDYRLNRKDIYPAWWRCEMILTDKCNFKCKYCRGLDKKIKGSMNINITIKILHTWFKQGLKNIRFSGGEPTLYKQLPELITECQNHNVERIAISTNGSRDLDYYLNLINKGVNDISISLDSGCCSIGDDICGLPDSGMWNKVVDNIKELSKRTYVTLGMVFTEDNINECLDIIKFADSLGASDIRVIPSAQYNKVLIKLSKLEDDIINKYSILKYRINNIRNETNVRGIKEGEFSRCWLGKDDMAVAGKYFFPCIIYLREGGKPCGEITNNLWEERQEWITNHDPYKDKICRENCLDVCIEYNKRYERRKTND